MNGKLTPERLRRALLTFVVTFCAGTSPPAVGNGPPPDIERLGRIREVVREHLAHVFATAPGKVSFEIGAIDDRLRLPRCDVPLTVDARTNETAGMHQRARVECEGTKPWSLYVPVTVSRSLPVVIVARAVARGEPLGPSALRVVERRVDGVYGDYFTDPAQVAGMSARRSLAAGHVVGPNDLEATRVVRRGQRVTLATYGSGIEVRASGIAMSDGGRGDRIPVRNEKSDRVVYGTVTADGRVDITAPPGS